MLRAFRSLRHATSLAVWTLWCYNRNLAPIHGSPMKTSLPFVLATILLAGCSTLTVNTDHDPRVNFARYHTYAWAPFSNQGYTPSPSTAALIQETLDQDLGAKGYRQSTNPDFLIAYHVTRRHKQSVTQVTQLGRPGLGGYGLYGGYGPYMYNDWGFGPGPRFRSGFGYYGLWPEYQVTYTDALRRRQSGR